MWDAWLPPTEDPYYVSPYSQTHNQGAFSSYEKHIKRASGKTDENYNFCEHDSHVECRRFDRVVIKCDMN